MSDTNETRGRIGRRLAYAAAAVLSAALLWSAFAPACETANLVVALVPLLVAARLCSPRRAAGVWFAGGFLFWFATLSWMPAIIKNNGPWPLVVLGWLGLAALCAGYFALFGWLAARAWRRFGRWGLLAEPLLWAGCEWLRATLFTGFAWNFLGTAVGQMPALAAPARLGGVYLVSALVVALNGVFATLACRALAHIRRQADAGPRVVRTLETAVPLGAILLVFWASQAFGPGAGVQTVPLRVALVQRNAPCIFSAAAPRTDPLRVYGRLLETAAAARPDLVVWGESAMAEFGRVESPAARRAAGHFIRELGGTAVLAGGDWRRADGKTYNAAALYTGDEAAVQLYGKQHLVPFGEYIPFDKWITPLQKLSPVGVSLWPGEATVFTLPLRDATRGRVALAPLICFEDTDPVLARRAARLGAQAIVLITNDSWFSHSVEAVQHAAQAVLRAVETGLPVIRTGNAGVTGVIAPSGRAAWLTDGAGRPLVDLAGTMVETVDVPVAPRPTPYTRLGDGPLVAVFALLVAALAVPPARKRAKA